ncbi:MAG: PQQ-binding-like beta-propeller repeat protein, partial [Armatimonadota bacterium]
MRHRGSRVLAVLGACTLLVLCASISATAQPFEHWRLKLDAPLFGGPAMGPDGTLYLSSIDGKLHAVSRDPGRPPPPPTVAQVRHIAPVRPALVDGAEKWSFAAGAGIATSPAVADDGTIYIGCMDGSVYAVDIDGSEKWRFQASLGISSGPAIAPDGTIYVGSVDHYLYALNPDGTEKWRFETGLGVSGNPAIDADGTVYVGSHDGNLYAINPDGSQRWVFGNALLMLGSPAIGADGTVYICRDTELCALSANGAERWSVPIGLGTQSSPTIATDGTVYVVSLDGNLYAVSPDGSEQWSFPIDPGADTSAAVGADGTLYVGSTEWWGLYAVNPDGSEKWRLDLGTSSGVSACPMIGPGGTIYVIAGGDTLHAVGVEGETPQLAESPWPMAHHDIRHTGRIGEQYSAHVVYFVERASGQPTLIGSGGSVQCRAEAACTEGHTVSYQWSAVDDNGDPVGQFDDPTKRSPVWTAPSTGGSGPVSYHISCRASCAEDASVTLSSSYQQQVLHSRRLALGAPVEDQVDERETKWYQLPVTTGQQIFVLLNKNSRWFSQLAIAQGSVPSLGANEDADQAVELTAEGDGYAYVRVDAGWSSGGAFTITAHSRQTFPTLRPGEPLRNQELSWSG